MNAPLPHLLAEIAAVAGEAAALAIAAERGGTTIYIPPAPGQDHWISKLVGLENARAIADRLTCGVGGQRFDVPAGPSGRDAKARARVAAMLADGCSERDIARATGYTARTVRRQRAQLERRGALADDPRQPRLI